MHHRFYPYLSLALLLSTLAALGWVFVLKQQLQDNQQLTAAQQRLSQEQLSAQQQANASTEISLTMARDSTRFWQQNAQQAHRQASIARRQLDEEIAFQTAAFEEGLRKWEELSEQKLSGDGWKTQVDFLWLYSKGLHRVPAQVYQCHGLQKLALGDNVQLNWTEILPALASLRNLNYLSLQSSHLQQLPPEIGQLPQLTSLDLDRNNLQSVPFELLRLQHLTTLVLSFNEFRGVPATVTALPELTTLDLSYNEIEDVSPRLGNLHKLNKLALRANKIKVLPPQIGQLPQLTELDLGYNKLTTLPPEMSALKNLRKVHLHNNPIPESERAVIRKLLPADCNIRFE